MTPARDSRKMRARECVDPLNILWSHPQNLESNGDPLPWSDQTKFPRDPSRTIHRITASTVLPRPRRSCNKANNDVVIPLVSRSENKNLTDPVQPRGSEADTSFVRQRPRSHLRPLGVALPSKPRIT